MRTSALALGVSHALELTGWGFVAILAARRGAGALLAPPSNGVVFFTLGALALLALLAIELRGSHRVALACSRDELRAVGPLVLCALLLPTADLAGLLRQVLLAAGWIAVGFWILLEDPLARFGRTWGSPRLRTAAPALPLRSALERRSDAWHDLLTGMSLLEFSAGTRQQHFHVPFNPPFARLPDVTAVCDDPDVQFTLGAVYPHGARWDVRRTGDARWPRSLPIRFSAEVALDTPEDAPVE